MLLFQAFHPPSDQILEVAKARNEATLAYVGKGKVWPKLITHLSIVVKFKVYS